MFMEVSSLASVNRSPSRPSKASSEESEKGEKNVFAFITLRLAPIDTESSTDGENQSFRG